ncbi:MAG TPA: hypothetical protein VKR06_33765 [Ktedonosporobacter sp.]|nr:hypothetical protein [Ktedonosporobacter sp.]
MSRWFKWQSLIIIVPVIGALALLPFWLNRDASASKHTMGLMGSISSSHSPIQSASFSLGANTGVSISGSLSCKVMTGSVTVSLMGAGQAVASGSASCAMASWSVASMGSVPAGRYSVQFVNNGAGKVRISYTVAPASPGTQSQPPQPPVQPPTNPGGSHCPVGAMCSPVQQIQPQQPTGPGIEKCLGGQTTGVKGPKGCPVPLS